MVLDVVDVVGLVVLVAIALLGALIVRRIVIARAGAAVECSVRYDLATPAGHGRGWSIGMARYGADDLQWFKLLSLRPQPRHTFARRGLRVVGRRVPAGHEAIAVDSKAVIVRCAARVRDGDPREIEIAMRESALTGFLAWIESAPPGAHSHPDSRRA